MNAARGTRRPHPTRVYKRGRKPSRSSGGGGKKGCALILLAFAVLPELAYVAARITGLL